MSEISDFTAAVVDVRNDLIATLQEAVRTHGIGVALSATAMFTATAVHQGEHHMDMPLARATVLGQFLSHFHAYLRHLNKTCDEQQEDGRDFLRTPPEGQA